MFDATALSFVFMILAFLLDNTPAYQDVIDKIGLTLNETALKDILVYAIGVAIVFVLFWFAVRKVGSIFMRAFKRGKLRL